MARLFRFLLLAGCWLSLTTAVSGADVIVGREPRHVRVLFGGDTCFAETYAGNPVKDRDNAASLVGLAPLLRSVDFRVLNLETPLARPGPGALADKDYVHCGDPVRVPAAFAPFRPLAFSLANNHTMDQGATGLGATFAALDAAGIGWFGAGRNEVEAARPLLRELRVGDRVVTLAVFGGLERRPKYETDYHFYAGAERPGVAMIDVSATRRAIAELRRREPEAFVVYFAHWGGNYLWKTLAQAATARALREAGVDLVIGAHAHMMQEVEWDGRGWIFYGLGNFVFNAPGRYATAGARPYSLPLVVDFSWRDGRRQVGLRVYPILSDNRRTGYQPRPVNAPEFSEVETALAGRSGWDETTRAAVRRGSDDVGPYLDFLAPDAGATGR